MPFTLSVSQVRFKEVLALVRAEADGKLLRAELRMEIKAILDPSVLEVKSGVLSMATGGLPHGGPGLREAIARGVKVGVASSGRLTGARVYVSKKGMPRGFANAPRDLNRESWHHPGGRGGADVTQVGAPGFFDRPLADRVAEYRVAITAAVERMAERIAHR